MHHSTDVELPLEGRTGLSDWADRPHIHVPINDLLDDDSLLHIFYLYRQVLFSEEVNDSDQRILQGGEWIRERWWYKLVHVCQRWRRLILASSSFLDLCLVCTRGVRVKVMLARSPPLPIIIDHLNEDYETTLGDERAVILALQHRDRVRRIRLLMPFRILQRLITAIDREFPMLEYLYIGSQSYTVPRVYDSGLILPKTFRAPHLRHLILINFALSIRSLVLTAPASLVTLSLLLIHPSAYFPPNDFLERISLISQLETLWINFRSAVPDSDLESQLLHSPITSHAVLPNLRWFGFDGISRYLEALLPWMTTPLLEKLRFNVDIEPIYFLPNLLHFMITAKNIKCGSARISFSEREVFVGMYPREGAKMYTFQMSVNCTLIEHQMHNAAQICKALRKGLSRVEDLTLEFRRPLTSSSQLRWGVIRTQCRELLGSFGNVKTLHVPTALIREVSHSLKPEDGESVIELLPELSVLACPLGDYARTAFGPFIHARQCAGFPVTLCKSPVLASGPVTSRSRYSFPFARGYRAPARAVSHFPFNPA